MSGEVPLRKTTVVSTGVNPSAARGAWLRTSRTGKRGGPTVTEPKRFTVPPPEAVLTPCLVRTKAAMDYTAYHAVAERCYGVPEGYEVHHLCRNPACYRPDHLAVVTASEHRRIHRTGYRQPVCKRGHDRTAPGALKGGRACRACERITERERRRASR